VDDDGTGWNEVLVGSWSPAVRRAVVRRVERSTVGWRGPLVRTLAAPDTARYAWTETLHRVVLRAIQDETGADLEDLGSHAAWACYEEVWDALRVTWADGGDLLAVPIGQEPAVVRLLRDLPAWVAEAGGADVSGPSPDPLWLRGRLRIDASALRTILAADDPRLGGADRLRLETLLDHATGRRG
jgi:hypothetical protein